MEITLISSMIRSIRRLLVDRIKLSLMKSDSTLKRVRFYPSHRHTCTCKCIIQYSGPRLEKQHLEKQCRRVPFAVGATTHRILLQQNENRSYERNRSYEALPLPLLQQARQCDVNLLQKRNFLINEAETRRGGGRDSAFREQRNGRRKRGVLSSDSLSSLFHDRAR